MVKSPLALFDAIEHIKNQTPPSYLSPAQKNDFLKSYAGSLGTFNSYRREIERLLQWCPSIANKSLKQTRRDDIEAFVGFCQKPRPVWTGNKKAALLQKIY
jgi:hypothetical protein